MCVKDCGLHYLNIDIIILFAFLVGWLNSSPVEIQKNEGTIFKIAWAGMNNSMAPCMAYFTWLHA